MSSSHCPECGNRLPSETAGCPDCRPGEPTAPATSASQTERRGRFARLAQRGSISFKAPSVPEPKPFSLPATNPHPQPQPIEPAPLLLDAKSEEHFRAAATDGIASWTAAPTSSDRSGSPTMAVTDAVSATRTQMKAANRNGKMATAYRWLLFPFRAVIKLGDLLLTFVVGLLTSIGILVVGTVIFGAIGAIVGSGIGWLVDHVKEGAQLGSVLGAIVGIKATFHYMTD